MRWFFDDGSPSDLAYSDAILASIKTRGAIVPFTWGLEVANVLVRAEAKSLVTPEMTNAFVARLRAMEIRSDDATFEYALSDTLHLARKYNLSSYDASYLELAMRLELPLATLDENLRKAAEKAGVKDIA